MDKKITLNATTDNLHKVLEFIEEYLDDAGCSMNAKMQVDMAAEEIFVNIAHYAYEDGKGYATVCVSLSDNPNEITITFIDSGIPYNPLDKADPDISLPAEERQIGGLGIFLTKKLMDGLTYAYENGQNILTMKKGL